MPGPEGAQRETAGRTYYALPCEEVLSIFDTAPAGLSASQARERLEQYGPNELTPPKKISPWIIFLRQFQNLLIIILIAFSVGLFSNRFLIGATLLSLLMMVVVVQAPALANLFHAVPLGWKEWLFAAFLAFLLFPVLEITKWLMRQIGRPATGLSA